MGRRTSKKRKWILPAGIAASICAAVFCIVHFYGKAEGEELYKETQVKKGNLTAGVTESGSVTIGTVSQDLAELEDLESSSSGSLSGGTQNQGMDSSAGNGNSSVSSTGLEVEEVYLAVGAYASTGDPILKLTEESVADYKKSLEEACTSAELALKKAQMEAKTTKLNAQYTYNSNVAQGSVAQSEYDASVAQLQASVDAAQAQVDASAAKIADYQARIKKGENCSAALAEEQANYNVQVSKLQSEQNTQTIKTVEAKQKYEEAMLKYNNAGSLYQIDTSGVDAAVEEAEETLEEAQEALSYFQALIGDGTIYAQYTGTVASVGYAEGDTVSSSTEVAAFADDSDVTMTVSVSQEDISAIQIGNAVEIALTAYEDKTYEGQVKAVDTSSSSGTSTVSYNVTVVFTGDVSDVYQDMTGNVTFISSQVQDVLYVSKKAVVMEGRETYVNVKRQDGTIEKIQVVTGMTDGINIEISEGLDEGDTVLIESQVKSE